MMSILSLISLSILFLVVIYYVFRPVSKTWELPEIDVRDRAILLAEKERVITNVNELDTDYLLGKIPKDDYAEQRMSMLKQGAEVMRNLLPVRETPRHVSEDDHKPINSLMDDKAEAYISQRRSLRREQTSFFCSNCGKAVMETDRFCPCCGIHLQSSNP